MMPKKSAPSQPGQTPPKRVYTRQYKLEVLGLLRNSGKTKADLERELGLYPGQIRLWERAFERDQQQAFPGVGHQTDPDR